MLKAREEEGQGPGRRPFAGRQAAGAIALALSLLPAFQPAAWARSSFWSGLKQVGMVNNRAVYTPKYNYNGMKVGKCYTMTVGRHTSGVNAIDCPPVQPSPQAKAAAVENQYNALKAATPSSPSGTTENIAVAAGAFPRYASLNAIVNGQSVPVQIAFIGGGTYVGVATINGKPVPFSVGFVGGGTFTGKITVPAATPPAPTPAPSSPQQHNQPQQAQQPAQPQVPPQQGQPQPQAQPPAPPPQQGQPQPQAQPPAPPPQQQAQLPAGIHDPSAPTLPGFTLTSESSQSYFIPDTQSVESLHVLTASQQVGSTVQQNILGTQDSQVDTGARMVISKSQPYDVVAGTQTRNTPTGHVITHSSDTTIDVMQNQTTGIPYHMVRTTTYQTRTETVANNTYHTQYTYTWTDPLTGQGSSYVVDSPNDGPYREVTDSPWAPVPPAAPLTKTAVLPNSDGYRAQVTSAVLLGTQHQIANAVTIVPQAGAVSSPQANGDRVEAFAFDGGHGQSQARLSSYRASRKLEGIARAVRVGSGGTVIGNGESTDKDRKGLNSSTGEKNESNDSSTRALVPNLPEASPHVTTPTKAEGTGSVSSPPKIEASFPEPDPHTAAKLSVFISANGYRWGTQEGQDALFAQDFLNNYFYGDVLKAMHFAKNMAYCGQTYPGAWGGSQDIAAASRELNLYQDGYLVAQDVSSFYTGVLKDLANASGVDPTSIPTVSSCAPPPRVYSPALRTINSRYRRTFHR